MQQALPAKPLEKGIILEEGGCATFSLYPCPRATGVLLTSHKKRLMIDSSDGNECAKGPGGEPLCAGLTPKAAQLRSPHQLPPPAALGSRALGKSSLSKALGASSSGPLDAREAVPAGPVPRALGISGQSTEALIVSSEQLGTLRPRWESHRGPRWEEASRLWRGCWGAHLASMKAAHSRLTLCSDDPCGWACGRSGTENLYLVFASVTVGHNRAG